MMNRFWNTKVRVFNPTEGEESIYGNTTPVDGASVEYPARVRQTTTEERKGQDTTGVTQWLLRLPADAVIGTSSIVEWDGTRYTVEGEPEAMHWPTGTTPSHKRAIIQKSTTTPEPG